jgi:hypothetical protein
MKVIKFLPMNPCLGFLIPLLLGSCFLVLNLSSAPQNKTFQVSGVGSDKTELLEVFDQIQTDDINEKLFKDSIFYQIVEVFNRIDEKYFLVKRKQSTDPFQKTNTLYWLVTNEPKDVVEEESIRLFYQLTEQIKTYTTTRGSNKSVRILKEVKADKLPPLLSKKEFVNRLQNGEEWTLESFRSVKCAGCFGDGKRGLDNNTHCNYCKGSGERGVDYLVKW